MPVAKEEPAKKVWIDDAEGANAGTAYAALSERFAGWDPAVSDYWKAPGSDAKTGQDNRAAKNLKFPRYEDKALTNRNSGNLFKKASKWEDRGSSIYQYPGTKKKDGGIQWPWSKKIAQTKETLLYQKTAHEAGSSARESTTSATEAGKELDRKDYDTQRYSGEGKKLKEQGSYAPAENARGSSAPKILDRGGDKKEMSVEDVRKFINK